jgi:hypothetical protein
VPEADIEDRSSDAVVDKFTVIPERLNSRMSLLGKAALAMWWKVHPGQWLEFSDWHSHEHFPERMSIPGFRRGSRWTSSREAGGFFVLYELEQIPNPHLQGVSRSS